jgi:acetyl-CoA carboxylase biotin carboxyl carrier protein
MDINQLKQILELVRDHELAEFEYEHDGLRLRVRKDGVAAPVIVSSPAPLLPAVAVAPAASAAASAAAVAVPAQAAEPAAGEAEVDLAVVKSPIVGTFYRSPEPGASSFVEIGSAVKKGQVLCIIEAMKLMNEIDSEYDGEIANIYVENGQPVQYGERLFAIRTR